MISKKDILAMARKVTRRSKGYKERKIMHPQREWMGGVCVFVIVAVVGGVVNAQVYVYYDAIEPTIATTTKPSKKYNAQSAQVANEMFTKRQREFDALAREVVIVPTEVSTSTATSSDDVVLEEDSGDEAVAVDEEEAEASGLEENTNEERALVTEEELREPEVSSEVGDEEASADTIVE